MNHVRGGYYVWLDGRRDSFWIPEARFLLWPLHVGLSVNFGGGWDPAGYYNVYDVGPGANAYRSTANLQGVVQSVDFDRGIVVVRDGNYGRFSTVLLRGDDARLGDLRPGDFVVLSGNWNNGGAFEAYAVEDLQTR